MKSYGLDYVAGSAAKKLYYEEEIENVPKVKKQVKRLPQRKAKMTFKQKFVWIASVLTVFSAFMVVIYRSNMISEANLKSLKLKSELEQVSSDLSVAMMELEHGQNLNEIEDYAKQKLGMQKPDKNQIVYVDTSLVEEVVNKESKSVQNNFLDSIKKFFNLK